MFKRESTKYGNDDIINGFSKEEKELLFSDLMDMYFRKNFGTVSKTDLETYLFSFYIEHLLDEGISIDDYTLGRDLGITLSRVRSLKERKELKYPRADYDWRDDFLKYAQNAKYDEKACLIKFAIPDVNVIKDVRNYFEKNNQYDEYQLNPKLFQCTLVAFEKMGESIAFDKGENFNFTLKDKNVIKELLADDKCNEKEQKIITRILTGYIEEGVKDLLINGSKEIILAVLGEIVPGVGISKTVFGIIKNALSR